MSALITISFTVPAGYEPESVCRLHGNAGAGGIDWDNPLTEEIFDLFPSGAGHFGWGHMPWGHFGWGHGMARNTCGWGHLPWGHFPWGHGAAIITASVIVACCGNYKFGFKAQDNAGNPHTGTPEEIETSVHIAPAPPAGLKFISYNQTTDTLVLEAA